MNEKKSGLHPLAWVAIGCGALLVIGGVAFVAVTGFVFKKAKDVAADFQANPAKAAAELVIRVNPDLELVASDEDAGTISFRNKKTGEEATLDYEDVAEGNFTLTTDDGQIAFSGDGEGGTVRVTNDDGTAVFGAGVDAELPDWIPRHPRLVDLTGTFSASGADSASGQFSFKSETDAETLIDYYESALRDEGFQVTVQRFDSRTRAGGMVTGIGGNGRRTVSVTVQGEGTGNAEGAIQFSEQQ